MGALGARCSERSVTNRGFSREGDGGGGHGGESQRSRLPAGWASGFCTVRPGACMGGVAGNRVRFGSTLGVAILATLSLILDLHRHPWLLAGLRSLPARTRFPATPCRIGQVPRRASPFPISAVREVVPTRQR